MAPEDAVDGASAGALLKAAREKQGLHIAALAAALKVTPRKLEALESNRLDELDGAIFTRALAQSVCRALRIDAKPVLALLPQPEARPLAHVSGSLNTPFRERGSRDDRPLVHTAQRVLTIGAVLLMVAAGLLFLVPLPTWRPAVAVQDAPATSPVAATPADGGAAPSTEPTAGAASAPAASAPAPAGVTSPVPVTANAAPVSGSSLPPAVMPAATAVASAPSATPAPSTAGPAATSGAPAAVAGAPLQITASAVTWIEVREKGGRVLISRLLSAGESVALEGAFPLQAIIGNAASTRVSVRGRVIDLASATRDNVARLEVAGDPTR